MFRVCINMQSDSSFVHYYTFCQSDRLSLKPCHYYCHILLAVIKLPRQALLLFCRQTWPQTVAPRWRSSSILNSSPVLGMNSSAVSLFLFPADKFRIYCSAATGKSRTSSYAALSILSPSPRHLPHTGSFLLVNFFFSY